LVHAAAALCRQDKTSPSDVGSRLDAAATICGSADPFILWRRADIVAMVDPIPACKSTGTCETLSGQMTDGHNNAAVTQHAYGSMRKRPAVHRPVLRVIVRS
jgi:hypothetical protein